MAHRTLWSVDRAGSRVAEGLMWTVLEPVMVAVVGGILWAIGFRRIPIMAWVVAIGMAGPDLFRLW